MLRHNNKMTAAKHDQAMQPLHIENPLLLKVFIKAKALFANGDKEAAFKQYETAIDECPINSLDQALCYYNAGKTLLYIKNRDLTYQDEIKEIYQNSYDYLKHACTIFECHFSTLPKDDPQYAQFIVHIQKTFAYMAKAAIEAKNGDNVFAASISLLHYIEKFPNDEFTLDAYRYLYQCCLAKNDTIGAQQFIDKATAITGVNHETEIRHQYKLQLIKALNMLDTDAAKRCIEKLLSSFYQEISDQDIESYRKNPSNHLRTLILKNFSFIFKMQLMYKTSQHAFNSVLKLARSVFVGVDAHLIKKLEQHLHKDLEMFNSGKLPLGMKLYENDEPPYLQFMTAPYQTVEITPRCHTPSQTKESTVESSRIIAPINHGKTEITATNPAPADKLSEKPSANAQKTDNSEAVSFRPAWMTLKKAMVPETPVVSDDVLKKPTKKN